MPAAPAITLLPDLEDLVRRMELEPQLLRRRIEEEIALLVPITDEDLSRA